MYIITLTSGNTRSDTDLVDFDHEFTGQSNQTNRYVLRLPLLRGRDLWQWPSEARRGDRQR
jgi:hypothetical protein